MVVKWNDLSNWKKKTKTKKKREKEKIHESNKKRFSCWSVNIHVYVQLQLPSFRTGGY